MGLFMSSTAQGALVESSSGFLSSAISRCKDHLSSVSQGVLYLGRSMCSLPKVVFEEVKKDLQQDGILPLTFKVSALLIAGGMLYEMGRLYQVVEEKLLEKTPPNTPLLPYDNIEWVKGLALVAIFYKLQQLVRMSARHTDQNKALGEQFKVIQDALMRADPARGDETRREMLRDLAIIMPSVPNLASTPLARRRFLDDSVVDYSFNVRV